METTRTCSVEGCGRPRTRKGFCDTHYRRWRKTGDAGEARIASPGRSDIERFMDLVDVSGGEDACHLWTGSDDGRHGYGRFRVDGRTTGAARWLLGHLRGRELNEGEQALHHCDNPPCVNPRHLYIGDQSQNMRDMVARNRRVNGNSRKTHCPQGHAYDVVNTYIDPIGNRHCRACRRDRARERA